MEEWFDIVDENDQVIGCATRGDCHGNPALVHRTAHVIVFASDGRVLLQKRSRTKDIQPGRWDTAVGGHLERGEGYEQAARREMSEELGIAPSLPLEFLFDSRIRNEIESENVRVFALVNDGPFSRLESEIDELRFWTCAELANAAGTGLLTPNLEREVEALRMLDGISLGCRAT